MSKLEIMARLQQSAMGIRVVGSDSDGVGLHGPDLPKARPAATRQTSIDASAVAAKVREIERLRRSRDRYLENARINQREADLAIEQDCALQAELIELVGEESVIDVDGVLYEISETFGVRVSDVKLLG
jgi:hypothetical protein